MTVEESVAEHYTTGGLLERILAALTSLGVDPSRAQPADLKPVDEFHIGGAAATRALLAQLSLTPESAVLDIGSGLGGTARLVAEETGASVTGVDLTPEFVSTAGALSRLVGLADRTSFEVGSALAMPFADDSFDVALLLHVGMNIPDKAALMAEAARVLKPGGTFAVYDVMKVGPDAIDFPVPWAETAGQSFLATVDDYRAAAVAAGFSEVTSQDRSAKALDFFADQRARMETEGAPALGIHLLLGTSRAEKIANMVSNISAGRIAPTELLLKL